MIFSSPIFFCFFVLYYFFHWVLPKQWLLMLLILGSTIFYSYWDPAFTWVPFLLIGIAYVGARWLARENASRLRKLKAFFVILFLVMPLLLFKYANFIYQNVLQSNEGLWQTSLPLGISFITFSLIAYVVEVYRRSFVLDHSLTQFSAFTLFFPHLIAGPILRPKDLLPQLSHLKEVLQKENIKLGLVLFSFGLLKKLVFSDPIGNVVDTVYASETLLTGLEYLLAIYGFSVQIYCDFSGYTDMALGTALALGITLPTNFEQPYCAHSLIDFWRRWHITLSQWLRDFIYIPLGGNRGGLLYQIRNVMITMLLGGLWHGANWTFIYWGMGHGILISLNHILNHSKRSRWNVTKLVEKIPNIIKIIITFHLVTLLWILFRAKDLATFCLVIKAPFVAPYTKTLEHLQTNSFPILLILLFFLLHKFDRKERLLSFVKNKASPKFWLFIAFLWILAIAMSMGNTEKFLYFDF